MRFTYEAYQGLIAALRRQQYSFCNYHNYKDYRRCVILRHDVDQSMDKAVKLAEIENEAEVCSTWFILLRSDFYNPAAKATLEKIKYIASLGHEIGLHFDEMAYVDNETSTNERIAEEAKILGEICAIPISTVSMHRPSKATLEANLEIPGLVNSYGQTFFHEFKYLSDSRCRWREPVEEIVKSGALDRLHILTHAIWYNSSEMDIASTIKAFVTSAASERYDAMKDNISDLESILPRESINGD